MDGDSRESPDNEGRDCWKESLVGGEWVLRKMMRQARVRLGGMGGKALGKEGRRHKDEKDASQPWKAQCRHH